MVCFSAFPARAARALVILLGPAILLSGCSLPLGPSGPQPSAGAIAACRQRADQEYLSQNRNALYQQDRYENGTKDTPFASTGLPEADTSQLTARFEQRQDELNCLNGGQGRGITADQPAPHQPGDAAPVP